MDTEQFSESLSRGARFLLEEADRIRERHGHDSLDLLHLGHAMLSRNPELFQTVTQINDPYALQQHTQQDLEKDSLMGDVDVYELAQQALAEAMQRGYLIAYERDLIQVFFLKAGALKAVDEALESVSDDSEPATTPMDDPADEPPLPEESGDGDGEFKALRSFGRDLIAEAKTGKFDAIIGRDEEVQLMMETLLRRTKRNPMLVGPAGVGKSAVVEMFAHRLANDDVPDALKGFKLFMIQPSSIVADSGVVGALEEKMNEVIEEATSRPDVILFIDEIHSLVAAGGARGTTDLASQLKPVLSRGEISVIGATTEDEYRVYIEPDGALTRRFQNVAIRELDHEATIEVLKRYAEKLSDLRKLRIPKEILPWFVEFADRYIAHRHFPDKAIDLLEQSVAHAVTRGMKSLSREAATTVAKRLVTMPLDVDQGLDRLEQALISGSMLQEQVARQLVTRLRVTTRALDFEEKRPNLVLLLAGEADNALEAIAGQVADNLFGSETRRVHIDVGGMVDRNSSNQLLGAPPGYIGYESALPLHRVKRMPFCVLTFENVHTCHPSVRDLLAQAFKAGVFSMNDGTTIPIRDTVVMLTGGEAAEAQGMKQRIGFGSQENVVDTGSTERELRKALEPAVGRELLEQVDMIVTDLVENTDSRVSWLSSSLLPDLAHRYRRVGMDVRWDPSVVKWLAEAGDSLNGWRRLIDQHVTPALLPFMDRGGKKRSARVTVAVDGGEVVARAGDA